MKNLTYSQLIELAPKDRPFQIEVEMSSGITYGKKTYWAYITSNYNLWTINDSYGCNFWKTEYKGTFNLIDPRYQKPEVLKVGQKVRIMESAIKIGGYRQISTVDIEAIGQIQSTHDDVFGVWYYIDFGKKGTMFAQYPHYCVMPVKEEERENTVKNDTLTINLVNADNISVKNIVVNYKDKDYKLEELSDTDKEIIKSKLK